MIEGVRMRLAVTVWNSTVEIAMASATSTSASSLRPRKGMMKLQLPLAPSVMKQTTETSAIAARISSTTVGRDQRNLPIVALPQEQVEEEAAADDPDDDADRDFIGKADDAPDDVAGEDERRAQNGHP